MPHQKGSEGVRIDISTEKEGTEKDGFRLLRNPALLFLFLLFLFFFRVSPVGITSSVVLDSTGVVLPAFTEKFVYFLARCRLPLLQAEI